MRHPFSALGSGMTSTAQSTQRFLNNKAMAAAQQAYDNMLPPEDHELTRAQEATVKEVLDWASIPDFVDEISNGLFEIAKVRLSPQAQKDLADSINDLVADAVGLAV